MRASDRFRHRIHQFEIRLDLPPGFGHMARIPLNIHAFTLSTEYSCIIHNAPVFEKGQRRIKSARPMAGHFLAALDRTI